MGNRFYLLFFCSVKDLGNLFDFFSSRANEKIEIFYFCSYEFRLYSHFYSWTQLIFLSNRPLQSEIERRKKRQDTCLAVIQWQHDTIQKQYCVSLASIWANEWNRNARVARQGSFQIKFYEPFSFLSFIISWCQLF